MGFQAGDLVSRHFPSRGTRMIQGATYTVAEVNSTGLQIRVEGDDRWYESSNFSIVGPFDH